MTFQLLKGLMAISVFILGQLAYGAEFGQSGSFGLGAQNADILPVDEAFVLKTVRTPEKIEVLWQIQPGHYLYRHRLAVKGSERLGEPAIPAGLAKVDEYFGDVEVYYDALIVEVPLAGADPEQITVEFQGCSDAGICYPPQKRRISL